MYPARIPLRARSLGNSQMQQEGSEEQPSDGWCTRRRSAMEEGMKIPALKHNGRDYHCEEEKSL